MRTLSTTLLAEQKKGSYTPLEKIVLTLSGETTQTYKTERILDLVHIEQSPWQSAIVLLDNSDNALTDLDLKGYQGIISHGMKTSEGEEYSATALLKVIAQQLISKDTGRPLTCILTLAGKANLVNEDKANDSYNPDEDDTKTVKTLIREILGDTGVTLISVYDHCDSYEVEFDSEDSLMSNYRPKDSFSISESSSRWGRVQWLLNLTECVGRWEGDGKFHIFKPTITGSTYNSEYSLASGGHAFFAKTYRKRLLIPNYIVVRSLLSQDTAYSGSAEDTDSINALKNDDEGESGEIRDFYRFRVGSDDDCDKIATAILSHKQLDAEKGHGFVPMNVGAEVYDYVKITDAREDDNRVGNVQYIKRHYKPSVCEMEFRFGKILQMGLAGTQPPSSSTTTDMSALLQPLWAYVLALAEMIQSILNYLEWLRKYVYVNDLGNLCLRGDYDQYVHLLSKLCFSSTTGVMGFMYEAVASTLYFYTKGGTLEHAFAPDADGHGKAGTASYRWGEGHFKKMYVTDELYIPAEA